MNQEDVNIRSETPNVESPRSPMLRRLDRMVNSIGYLMPDDERIAALQQYQREFTQVVQAELRGQELSASDSAAMDLVATFMSSGIVENLATARDARDRYDSVATEDEYNISRRRMMRRR